MHQTETEDERSKEVGLDPGDGMAAVSTRILEIRKEKSRDAARSRRGKENYEFYELAKLLPLPNAITSQLDKASIIRLSISYLKLREFSGHGDPPWTREGAPPNKTLKGAPRRRNSSAVALELFEMHQGTHILQTLDGFAFALASDGRFLYISETVSIYLGLSQVEMAGSSIFDYVHHQDHQELADQLGLGLGSIHSNVPSPASPSEDGSTSRAVTPPISDRVPVMTPNFEKGKERSFCLRMKSTLTKRGVHVRCSGYRVVHIIGSFRHQLSFGLNRKQVGPLLGLVGIAVALPPPTITELRIENDTFIMRLSPEFRIVYCENMVSSLTDWVAEDLCNKSLYEFCHAGDLNKLRKSHIDLVTKGQVVSEYMRLMNKNGGYVWYQMFATSLYNSKTTEDQTILCVCYVLSAVEHRGCVMDTGQLPGRTVPKTNRDPDDTGHSNCASPNDPEDRIKDYGSCHSSHDNAMHESEITDLSAARSSPSGQDKSCRAPSFCDSQELEMDLSGDKHEEDCLHEMNENSDILRTDGKVSRRKADRPRRRKRDYSSDEELLMGEVPDSKCGKPNEKEKEDALNFSMDSRLQGEGGGGLCRSDMDSLSTCNNGNKSASLPSSPDNDQSVVNLLSPQKPEDLSVKPTLERHNSVDSQLATSDIIHRTVDSDMNSMTPSSVKELEEVMNKHLPSHVNRELDLKSSDLACRITSPLLQKQKSSTIQWVGAGSQQTSDSLAASALLRSIYANRDTVIRSNARPQFFNSDNPAMNMLTPPGSDGFKDHLQLSIPQLSVPNKGDHSLYNASHVSVSMPNSMTDTFSMTPPSSVSPQDKVQSPFQDTVFPEHCSIPVSGSAHGNNRLTSKAHAFSAAVAPDYHSAKPSYLSGPHFGGSNSGDFHPFEQSGGVPGGLMAFDSRTHAGTWYS